MKPCIRLLLVTLLLWVLFPSISAANQAPSVRITMPQNGQIFSAYTNVLVEAVPQDPDGLGDIRHVEFYDGSKRIGVSTNYPWATVPPRFLCMWTNVTPGQHTLTARAHDSIGQSAVSDPVVIQVMPAPYVTGYLRRLLYTNIFGIAVSSLQVSPKFPDHPDQNILITPFEAPVENAPNYGQKIYGYVLPPRSGDYRFFMAADDQAVLYLSTDDQPINKVQIASEPTWRGPRAWVGPEGLTAPHISQPIPLQQGHRYYVEVLHKQGAGGENLAVTWQMPGDPIPVNGSAPIPGMYLAADSTTTLTNKPPFVNLTQPRSNDVFWAEVPVRLAALTYDVGGFVEQVEMFAGNQSLGLAESFPYLSSATFILMWTNAPVGHHVLRAVARDNSGLCSTSAPVPILVTNSPPAPHELHVVGLYSGSVNGQSSRTNEEGTASVLLDRPYRSVTLVLSAYEPVHWFLSVTPGTILEKVILAGMYPQRITGVPSGIPVTTNNSLYTRFEIESKEFYDALPRIEKSTELLIGSFHGFGLAPYPQPIVIDSLQNDPRLRSSYPELSSGFPALGFPLWFYDHRATPDQRVFVRDYFTGTNACNLLPAWRMVHRPVDDFVYGASPDHGAAKVRTATGELLPFLPPAELPEVSWPMSVAYDSLRDRLLLASLGGTGFLYAYSPQTATWSVVTSLDYLDIDSLVYHAALDSLYAFESYRADHKHPRLVKLNSAGQKVGEIALPFLPFNFWVGEHQSELVSVGNYLVLLIAPSENSVERESRMYVIDPRNGMVWLTHRCVLVNDPPMVTLLSPTNNSTFYAPSGIPLVARASDPDGNLAYVDFRVNGEHKMFVASTPGDPFFRTEWRNPPPGNHVITAVAWDHHGLSQVSQPVRISIWAEAFVRSFTNTLVYIRAQPGAMTKVYAVEDLLPPGWSARYPTHDGVFDPATRKVKFGPYFDSLPRQLRYEVVPPKPFPGPCLFTGTASVDGRNVPVTGQSMLVLPYPHPAEVWPNWRMEIAEVTAYGAAWREGRTWTNPPSPIPMDYVTRAGLLWRMGEAYKMNTFGTPPLWWVPTNVFVALAPTLQTAEAPLATRRVLNSGNVQVHLSISGNAGTQAYAVTEKIPSGCTVASVTASGVIDAARGEIRWGPFLDGRARELEYMLQDAPGDAVAFEGAVSFDGQSVSIAGARSFELPPRLEWRAGQNRKELHLRSRAGSVCVVETSADLQKWQPLMTVTNTTGLMKLETPSISEQGARYYRLAPVR